MKLFAFPKTKVNDDIKFNLGWEEVDDEGYLACANFDERIAVICDSGGSPINCPPGKIPPGAKLPKDFFEHDVQPETTEQSKPVVQKLDEIAPPDDPSMSWKKSELKAYCDEHGIEYNSGDTKSDLVEKIEWANEEE